MRDSPLVGKLAEKLSEGRFDSYTVSLSFIFIKDNVAIFTNCLMERRIRL